MTGVFVFKCGAGCGAKISADKLNQKQFSQVKLKPTKCKRCNKTTRWEEAVVLKPKPAQPSIDPENENLNHRGVYL